MRASRSKKKTSTKKKTTKKKVSKKKVTRKKVTVKRTKTKGKKKAKAPTEKKAENKRPDQLPNGRFAPGNDLGNRWQKGQSGNPKGRPKGRLLADILREHLFSEVKDKAGNVLELEEGVPATRADLLMRKAVESALAGNFQFTKEIWDRLDGKVPSKVDAEIANKASVVDLMLAASAGELPVDDEEEEDF